MTAPASRGVVQANLVHIISAPAIPVLITGPEVKKWIKPRSVDYNNLHVVGCRSEAKATSDQGLVKAMHLNVRSANNKAVRINEYVEEKDPDFLAMTETWIRFGNATINAMCPAGYRFIGKPRKERGGGVGFMYKSTFEVREDDKLLGDYKTMEHLLVMVEGNVTWRIATVYRPPPSSKNGLTNSQFLKDMEAMLTELSMLPGRLLIMGDFNLHFDDLNDKHVRSFRDLLEAVGMTQHVTQPTHRDGHILDFVISAPV